jgi:hypothetical protein
VSFEPIVGGDEARSDDCDGSDKVTTTYSSRHSLEPSCENFTLYCFCVAVICNIYIYISSIDNKVNNPQIMHTRLRHHMLLYVPTENGYIFITVH